MSFSIQNDNLAISDFNTNTSIISLNGNLGIGTIPQYQLDIVGTASFDNFSDISNSTGDDSNVITKTATNSIWGYNQTINNTFPINTVTLNPTTLPSGRPYKYPCLAPNGKIYCMPFTNAQNQYLIINTHNDTVSFKTSSITVPAGGSVCAYNGKIYSPPLWDGNRRIRVIDTINNDSEYILTDIRVHGYNGCCLGPNGKIYCVPCDFPKEAPLVLVIDPRDDSLSFIPVTGVNRPTNRTSGGYDLNGGIGDAGGDDVWYGGVLGPNGKIYCMPGRGTSILVIDTINNTAQCEIASLDPDITNPNRETNSALDEVGYPTRVGKFQYALSIGGQANKYNGGVLAPNGKIYVFPGCVSNQGVPGIGNLAKLMVINPVTDTIVTPSATVPAGTRLFVGGTLGLDGKIYASIDAGASLYYSITTEPTLSINGFGSGRGNGTCLGPNGKIYMLSGSAVPYQLRIITTDIQTQEKWMLAPEFNKF